MSAVETGQMSAVETGQMSAAETGQMSSVETRQMSAVARTDICLAPTHNVQVADVSIVPTPQCPSLKHHNVQVSDRRSGPKSTKMVRNGPSHTCLLHRTTLLECAPEGYGRQALPRSQIVLYSGIFESSLFRPHMSSPRESKIGRCVVEGELVGDWLLFGVIRLLGYIIS